VRSRRLVVLVVLGLLAAAVACTSDDDADTAGSDDPAPGPSETATLRVGIQRPQSFDPAGVSPADQSELLAADLLYDGLTAAGPQGRAEPALAESWQASADQRTWRFVLLAGARFSDGRTVTAADAKRSLERVAARGSASLAGVRLDVVTGYQAFVEGTATELTGVRAIDDRTVQITLATPLSTLPELLSAPSYGLVGSVGTTPPVRDALVGAGPFHIVSVSDEVVALGRSPLAETSLERVELHQYDDLEAAYADFVSGRLDVSLVPAARVDDAGQRFGTDAFVPFGAEVFYGFNLANPKFADARFRQAIVRAVDRDALVEAVYPTVGIGLAGIVPEGIPGHVPDPCGEACAYSPDAARALVAAVFPAGGVPEVQIDYYEDPGEEAVASIIETNLEAVGIPAARRPRPFDEYQEFAVSGAQELFRLGWIGIYPSPEAFLGPLFGTGSPDNATGFADPTVQALLDAARADASVPSRTAAYQEAERAVLARSPVVPIVQFRTRMVVADRVDGLDLGVNGTFDVSGVELAEG
jgi:ABC-type transport system substrate-binding protein